jgi:hypothetical protein
MPPTRHYTLFPDGIQTMSLHAFVRCIEEQEHCVIPTPTVSVREFIHQFDEFVQRAELSIVRVPADEHTFIVCFSDGSHSRHITHERWCVDGINYTVIGPSSNYPRRPSLLHICSVEEKNAIRSLLPKP